MQFVCKLWLKSNHAWRIDTLWFDNIGNSREFPRNSHKLRNSPCYHWEFPGIPQGIPRKLRNSQWYGEEGRREKEEGRKVWSREREKGMRWREKERRKVDLRATIYMKSYMGSWWDASYFSVFNQQTTGFNRNMPKMVHKMPWRIFVYQYRHI